MKSVARAVLHAVLATSLLTACGGGDATSADGSPVSPASAIPTPSPDRRPSIEASLAIPKPPLTAPPAASTELTTGAFTPQDAAAVYLQSQSIFDVLRRNAALARPYPKTAVDFAPALNACSPELRTLLERLVAAYVVSTANGGADSTQQPLVDQLTSLMPITLVEGVDADTDGIDTTTGLNADGYDPEGYFGPAALTNVRVYDFDSEGTPAITVRLDGTIDFRLLRGTKPVAVRERFSDLDYTFVKIDGRWLLNGWYTAEVERG